MNPGSFLPLKVTVLVFSSSVKDTSAYQMFILDIL